jgi:hypothetical protein
MAIIYALSFTFSASITCKSEKLVRIISLNKFCMIFLPFPISDLELKKTSAFLAEGFSSNG